MVSNATVGLAGLAVLLLLVLIVLIFGLRRQLAELAVARDSQASHARSGAENPSTSLEPLLQQIGNAVVHLHEQIASFDIVFSDMQEQLVQISERLQDMQADRSQANTSAQVATTPSAGSGTQPVPETEPARYPRPTPASISSEVVPETFSAARPGSSSETQPFVTEPANQTPVAGASSSLIDEYRQLIAEPRKNEINRWADENGGISCMVNEDGTILPLPRDAGGLLVALQSPDGTSLLVPGGRMVVDFATSFASPISMRGVTRDCFNLSGDGTGILRLIEPARIESRGEGWTVVSPGLLSGFTS